MSAGIPVGFLILLLAVPLWLAGGVLLIAGWPRRRGNQPHCRACDYSLVGSVSDTCPECGAALMPASIVHGERIGRRGLWWTGLALVLAGVLAFSPVVYVVLSGIDWYQYQPTFLVVRDLRSGRAPTVTRAWQELQRREQAGKLSAGARQELIVLALTEQAAPTTSLLTRDLVEYLGRRCLVGELTPEQKTRFFQQMVLTNLRARPKVARGDTVSYLAEHSQRGPSQGWWIELHDGPVCLDGKKITDGGGGSSASSGFGGGSFGSGVRCATTGPHTLEVTMHVAIHRGPFNQSGQGSELWSEDRKLAATFEVLPDVPADYIRHVDSNGLAEPLRASMNPVDFTFNKYDRQAIAGTIAMTAIPAPVAFEVLARWNGQEVRLGSIAGIKGSGTQYSVQGEPLKAPPPEKVDIVLRSSDKVARDTVDLTEIWAGEIVYRDVPVKVEKGK